VVSIVFTTLSVEGSTVLTFTSITMLFCPIVIFVVLFKFASSPCNNVVVVELEVVLELVLVLLDVVEELVLDEVVLLDVELDVVLLEVELLVVEELVVDVLELVVDVLELVVVMSHSKIKSSS